MLKIYSWLLAMPKLSEPPRSDPPLEQADYSVEVGLAENGQIVNPLNSEGNVTLPGGMPAISNGTPVWLAQSF